MKSFSEKVFSVVVKVPQGKTLTYKEMAVHAGSPRAFRVVGNILNKNDNPNIPCHRVIRSDKKAGGYNRGAESTKRKLDEECTTF
jgi:O-6-methylguanine DNA methyltransferase